MKYYLLTALIAYLLGSLTPSVWLGKFIYKVDLRKYGSNNPGASNAIYVFGKLGGAVVLLIDVLKGYLALYLAQHLFQGFVGDFRLLLFIASFFAVLGHCNSIFLKFRGGKGFATFLGVNIYHFPQVMLWLILLFVTVVLLSKYISIGTFTMVGSVPLAVILTQHSLSALALFFMLATSALIVYRHRENVVRLANGTEISIKTPHIDQSQIKK